MTYGFKPSGFNGFNNGFIASALVRIFLGVVVVAGVGVGEGVDEESNGHIVGEMKFVVVESEQLVLM